MISEYCTHLFSDPVLLVCSTIMLGLFYADLLGLLGTKFKFIKWRYRSLGGSIVSIGLFTTFLGILSGLYGFNTASIADSVPQLLEGLRFAFAGSVLGMFLSLVLAVLQKFLFDASGDEEVLHNIDRNIASLVASFQEPQEMVKQFGDMKSFLKLHLEKINTSLDVALTELAKGATQEVIAALEGVISDFNKNLSEQFGENFKELNAACLKLVEWQREYKEHLEETGEGLDVVLESLEQSSASAKEMNESNEKTQKACSEIAEMVKTYDVQVKTLEKHLQSCEALGENATTFLTSTQDALTKSSENMSAFSGVIEESVSKQSEALAQLTEDIDVQLPKALHELERVLVSLTNQFAGDYRSLFEYVTKRK